VPMSNPSATPVLPPSINAAIKFRLVNAVSDTVISEILDNGILNTGAVPANSLTLEVSVEGLKPASVRISLTGAQHITVIEKGILALCGNYGTDLVPCSMLTVGKYNITADIYSSTDATGQIIASRSISFELINDIIPIPVAVPVFPPITKPTQLQPISQGISCNIPKVSVGQYFHSKNRFCFSLTVA
jgi:hypothetical protein